MAKRYSCEEKYKYHSARDSAPGRVGLKFCGGKHMYSFGFADGFKGHNNASGVRGEFGKKQS